MTDRPQKFRPEITALDADFWASVRRRALSLQQCDECGRFRFVPSERCRCGSPASTWTPIAGSGEVYTFTVVHRAPTPAYQDDAPYVLVHVSLPEGPRMIGTLVGVDGDQVHIGMAVRVDYEVVDDDLTLYRFVPDAD